MLIKFSYRNTGYFSRFAKSELVQTKSFEFGFILKNIGDSPIKGATIKNIRYVSASGQNIGASVEKSFHFDTLNPGEEKNIWVEKVGTYMYGLCNVTLSLDPDTTGDVVKTYQEDPFTKIISSVAGSNHWIDFFFIRSKNEYEQSHSNSITFFLGVMSVISSVIAAYLAFQQTNFTEIQSRPDRILQAQATQAAVEKCKEAPELKESGLFDTSNGNPAPCSTVLQLNK